MALICPTVLADSPAEFSRQMERVQFAKRIQIDLADGDFAPTKSINLNQVYFNDGQLTDLHLMLREPRPWLEMIVSLAPNLVIFHAEVAGDLLAWFAHLRKFKIKVGVALLPETNVDTAADLIRAADHVLIFGGHLGYMGGTADLAQLKKVTEIRKINSEIEIGWDGGANMENAKILADGGIDIINVGSAIMKSENPKKTHQELSKQVL
jgi:ribulose-phosphate 3-epimerase